MNGQGMQRTRKVPVGVFKRKRSLKQNLEKAQLKGVKEDTLRADCDRSGLRGRKVPRGTSGKSYSQEPERLCFALGRSLWRAQEIGSKVADPNNVYVRLSSEGDSKS
jgi:hypothetical protein